MYQLPEKHQNRRLLTQLKSFSINKEKTVLSAHL